jgi:hypothetical protein
MIHAGTSTKAIHGCSMLVLVLLVAACGGGGGGDSGGGGTPPPGGGGPTGGGPGGTPPATWTQRAAGGDTISAVARSGNTFVALTEENLLPGRRVLMSTDGYTWSHPAYTGSPPSGDIVFGNNLFVAVGTFSTIATSPNGIAWTQRLSCSCFEDFLSVAWSGSAFVAVGDPGIVRRSSDGITWTIPTTPPVLGTGALSKLRSVAASGTTFVAVGMNSTTLKGAIFYSVDGGVTWTAATVTPVSDFEFERVAWDGTRFLAMSFGTVGNGGTWTSTDGITWSHVTATLTAQLTPTPGGATPYIGTNGVGNMKTSSDAATWTDRYNFVHHSITDILWMQDRGEYLVTASASDSRGFIATSTDAVTWQARYTSDRRTGVVWDGTRFVSIDNKGRVYTSSDGVTWSSDKIIPGGGLQHTYFDIAWSGARYVVVGTTQIASSTDGSNWSQVLGITNRDFMAATWNGTEFAAITLNGEIFRSTSGTSWPAIGTTVSTGGSLNDLAWAGGSLNRYVAVGSGGNVYYSDNGTAWTGVSSNTTSSLRSVIWTGSQFVAVGDSGAVVTSPDGSSWTNRSIAGGPTFNAVAFVDSQLVAVGSGGKIYVSLDGISWTEQTSGTTHALYAVAASPTREVAMGDSGVIVTR